MHLSLVVETFFSGFCGRFLTTAAPVVAFQSPKHSRLNHFSPAEGQTSSFEPSVTQQKLGLDSPLKPFIATIITAPMLHLL